MITENQTTNAQKKEFIPPTQKRVIELYDDATLLQRIIMSHFMSNPKRAEKIEKILEFRDEMDAEKLILPSAFYTEYNALKATLQTEFAKFPSLKELTKKPVAREQSSSIPLAPY